MIVRDGAERAAGFCPLEENGETRDQKSGDQAAPDIELVDEDTARKQTLQREPSVRRVQLERIDVRSERQLGRAFNDECGADGRHEQDQAVLIDQWAEHETLDNPRRKRHYKRGEQKRADHGDSEWYVVCDQEIERAHQRKAGQQNHRTLREVEHARRLEDQHETERDERVEDARQQTAAQHFDEVTQTCQDQCTFNGRRRDRRR